MNQLLKATKLVLNPISIFKDIFLSGIKQGSYMSGLLIIQLLSFLLLFSNGKINLQPDTSTMGIIGLIAGISGIINVVLIAKGKMTNFFWGLINTAAYIYVSFESHLYGEVYLNLYFFVMQFIGAYQWSLHTNKSEENNETVKPKELNAYGWIILTVVLLISWIAFSKFLATVPFITATIDPHPYLDALSVVLQVIAQILMTMRYGSSQWLLWFLSDVVEIILWSVTFNPIMIALWIAFLINSLYGWYTWTHELN